MIPVHARKGPEHGAPGRTRTRGMSVAALLGMVCLVAGLPARADFVNGSFETGNFNGWTTAGSALITTAASGITPPAGTFQAITRTGVGRGATPSALEAFVGVGSGGLNTPGNVVFNGSAVRQTVAALAGDTLTFSWNFLSNDTGPGNDFNDFAFVVINGTVTRLASLNTTALVAAPAASGYLGQTNYRTFSLVLAAAGSYTVSAGGADVNDNSVIGVTDSALLVDNFRLVPIPEPSSVVLVGLGLAGLAGRAVARRRAA